MASVPDRVDRVALRRALGSFLTGVTVVTTLDDRGRPRGMTANSFTSVSLDPPLVLVSVDRAAASYSVFKESRGYVVHILGAHQRDLAAKFASKDADKFDGLERRRGVSGAPILTAVPGWIDCVTEQAIDAGDHVLLIGKVNEFRSTDDRPLGYHQGRFVTFDPEFDIQTMQQAQALCVGWVVESDAGRVALEHRSDGTCGIPLRPMSTRALTDEALAAQASETIGAPVATQFLYSMYPRDGVDDLALVYRGVLESDPSQHLPSGIRLYSGDEFPWQAIRNRSERAILRRYLREREGDGFGIYAGTEASGAVAMVSAPYMTPPPAQPEESMTVSSQRSDRSQP